MHTTTKIKIRCWRGKKTTQIKTLEDKFNKIKDEKLKDAIFSAPPRTRHRKVYCTQKSKKESSSFSNSTVFANKARKKLFSKKIIIIHCFTKCNKNDNQRLRIIYWNSKTLMKV